MTDAAAPSPQGFSHVGIQVADLERSVRFYGDLLGLELVTRWVRDQEYIQELVGYPGVELNVAGRMASCASCAFFTFVA